MTDQAKQSSGSEKAEAPAPAAPGAGSKADAKAGLKAEAKAEAKDTARTEAKPATTTAAKPSLGAALPLIAVIVVALAAGGAAGGLLVAPRILAARNATPAMSAAQAGESHGAAAKKSDKHGEAAKSSVYRLENLIVNPAGTQGTRFLMASVVFELPEEKGQEILREHEAQVRDAVIAALERQTLEQLTRPGAREQIKKELITAVAPITGEMHPVRVYLPQFVLQ